MHAERTSGQATCTQLPGITVALPFVHTQVAALTTAGGDFLFAAPYSSTLRSHLFVIALPDGTVEKYPLQDAGAHAIVAGGDGNIYLGTYSGRLLRFHLADRTLTEIGHTPHGEQVTCGFQSANGRLYFGTDAGAILELTLADELAIHTYTPAGASNAVVAFTDLPDDRVAAFCHSPQPTLLVLTPGGGTCECRALPAFSAFTRLTHAARLDDERLLIVLAPERRVLCLSATTFQLVEEWPALPEDDAIYCLQVAEGRALVCGSVTGAIYRGAGQAWERLGSPMPYEPVTFLVLPSNRLAGVTYHGHLVLSSRDWRMFSITSLPTSEADGLAIQALGIGPDRKLYFAPSANMRVGCWDPEEDEVVIRFIASPYVGEVSAIGLAGERLLLGFADACGMMAYYPDLPYRLLENPKLLGTTGHGFARPLGPLAHHTRHIYFAAACDSPLTGGGIVRYNPQEDALTTFHGILPGQILTSLVVDRLNDLLVVGGRRLDNVDGHAPAALALWSPFAERTVRQITPFPDAKVLYAWAAEGGRLYVTDGGVRFAVLSAANGEILVADDFPLGPIDSLISTQHGELYGLAGGWLFHFDVEQQRIDRLAEATGTLLTEVRAGLFAYTHQGRLYKAQLWR